MYFRWVFFSSKKHFCVESSVIKNAGPPQNTPTCLRQFQTQEHNSSLPKQCSSSRHSCLGHGNQPPTTLKEAPFVRQNVVVWVFSLQGASIPLRLIILTILLFLVPPFLLNHRSHITRPLRGGRLFLEVILVFERYPFS
jgi:hypothetical protein